MGRMIIDQHPQNRHEVVNAVIMRSTMETALHVAAGANQAEFVEMLVNDKDIDLTFRDTNGNTAFCTAIAAGATRIAEKFLTLTKPRDYFIKTRGGQNMSPLYIASSFGQAQIASVLYKDTISNVDLEAGELFGIFFNCIHNDIYDLAIKMVEDEDIAPKLILARDTTNETALHIMSRKRPSDFTVNQVQGIWSQVSSRISRRSSTEMPALILAKNIWKRVLEENDHQYSKIRSTISYPFNLVLEAAKVGNFDLLAVLIRLCPDLIWEKDDANQTIFHFAILNRHVKIFKLMHEIGLLKSLVQLSEDENGNSILHLVAKIPHQSRLNSILGAALQMRHELLWFQEVEKIVAPSLRNKRNFDHKTPNDVFTEEHMKLTKNAEKWMKENANTCIIVATIIVTVAFPAAFSIQGEDGNKHSSSLSPVSQPSSDHISIILLVSNTIAMSFSSIAVMLFLSIMISRFTEKELLWTLPCTFVAGLSLLFISVAAMMVSFCFASFIPNGFVRIAIFTSCVQLVPITLFLYLVYPVLRDTVHSTFFSQHEFNPRNNVLQYYEM
ncbi:uncharacterized protein LOC133825823 [Humulus lupulus]|uniref:uncharacterized protein LOC133825823 n=1 Tax=Humulus lupulus TaxID=3486 RepID=UPI002B416AE1|nr:uncharacterized protein LOC133825823 [Humulus lupulus]